MNRLKARVIARNRCNKAANELYQQLIPILKPLIGQKVTKTDGTLLAKINAQVKALDLLKATTHELNVFATSSAYNLAWTIKACQNVEDDCVCVYEDTTIYVANLEDQHLKDLNEREDVQVYSHHGATGIFRTDYTVEEVTKLREDFKTAEKAFQAAQSALEPFGRIDR